MKKSGLFYLYIMHTCMNICLFLCASVQVPFKVCLIRIFVFKGLSFDLGDSTVWEFMFPNNDKPLLKIPDAEDDLNDMDDDEV